MTSPWANYFFDSLSIVSEPGQEWWQSLCQWSTVPHSVCQQTISSVENSRETPKISLEKRNAGIYITATYTKTVCSTWGGQCKF